MRLWVRALIVQFQNLQEYLRGEGGQVPCVPFSCQHKLDLMLMRLAFALFSVYMFWTTVARIAVVARIRLLNAV